MRKKGTRRKKFALCKRENTTIEYYEKRAETEKGGGKRERERVTLYVSNPQSFFPDQPSKEKSTSFKPGENRAIL